MDVVYATGSAMLAMPDGSQVFVTMGSHWLPSDPVVRAHPEFFAPNARYGLAYSGPPPVELSEPPLEQTTRGPGERRNTRRG